MDFIYFYAYVTYLAYSAYQDSLGVRVENPSLLTVCQWWMAVDTVSVLSSISAFLKDLKRIPTPNS